LFSLAASSLDPLTTLKSIVILQFLTDSTFTTWLLHDLLPSITQHTKATLSFARFSPYSNSFSLTFLSTICLSTYAMSEDIDMHENSPPRVAGNKRAAVNSPIITPPGTKHTDPVVPDDSTAFDTQLKPSRLEDKFGKPPKKKPSSTSNDIQILDGKEDGGGINLLDQQAYEALIQDPPPPTPAQYLQYDFDEADKFTLQNLVKYNSCTLEEELR
jgi:hypothetical protein